ncbi:hypothetical protein [Endozoicomonas sp. ONNA2]|uniref:hypothetical protein n=1 Tax=Endozoicomonas sp. ONNA2 TaxID=2828741 RepID=UPI0021472F80|nr:hypothetical protein [Endozoicomonas sp. ONNA2]
MLPLSGSLAQSLPPSLPSESERSKNIATALNETVNIPEACSQHLTDSGELPDLPLDQRQITESTSCVANIAPEKKPEKFQENDILLVYPCESGDRRDLNLSVNLAELKRELYYAVDDELEFRYHFGQGVTEYTSRKINSTVDSILTRLPAELTEFLNQDYPDEKLFSPEEYQALARFHCAILNDLGYDFYSHMNDEDRKEFEDFFIKECLPLRDGWSKEELEYFESWLNYELSGCQGYDDFKKMKKHIKTCHYGPLKAGCVTVCSEDKVIENREAYENIKKLENQLTKMQPGQPEKLS